MCHQRQDRKTWCRRTSSNTWVRYGGPARRPLQNISSRGECRAMLGSAVAYIHANTHLQTHVNTPARNVYTCVNTYGEPYELGNSEADREVRWGPHLQNSALAESRRPCHENDRSARTPAKASHDRELQFRYQGRQTKIRRRTIFMQLCVAISSSVPTLLAVGAFWLANEF